MLYHLLPIILKYIIPCFALKPCRLAKKSWISEWLSTTLIILICFYSYSEDVCKRGFTVIIDMRGSKWDLIKPLLKTLQEAFPAEIHVALIIKPDNFWQKQKTNFGSSKFIFEVRARWEMYDKALALTRIFLQVKQKIPKPCDWEKKKTFEACLKEWADALASGCLLRTLVEQDACFIPEVHIEQTLVRVFLCHLFLVVLHSVFPLFL